MSNEILSVRESQNKLQMFNLFRLQCRTLGLRSHMTNYSQECKDPRRPWPFDPNINGFLGLIVEYFYVKTVKFGDPSCIGFWYRTGKQTDRQTDGVKNRTPATNVGVGKYQKKLQQVLDWMQNTAPFCWLVKSGIHPDVVYWLYPVSGPCSGCAT